MLVIQLDIHLLINKDNSYRNRYREKLIYLSINEINRDRQREVALYIYQSKEMAVVQIDDKFLYLSINRDGSYIDRQREVALYINKQR